MQLINFQLFLSRIHPRSNIAKAAAKAVDTGHIAGPTLYEWLARQLRMWTHEIPIPEERKKWAVKVKKG
jgi:hypothetical protein